MDRIRELRNEKGLSQAKLAVIADMDPATLNRLEQGKGNPNLRTLERVADALGVPVTELFKESPQPEAPPPLTTKRWVEKQQERGTVALVDPAGREVDIDALSPPVVDALAKALRDAMNKLAMKPDDVIRLTVRMEEGETPVKPEAILERRIPLSGEGA